MEPQTHWIVDNFYADAHLMRQKIDEHFDENIGKKLSLRRRTIWNYWYIDKLYTYFRTDPRNLFPELQENFMESLKEFAAREFGLKPSIPFLSMYINGCGQGLHNDSGNGRLGFVFSLTNWKERKFEGGETILHKFNGEWNEAQFRGVSGAAFYHLIEPEFNRLIFFDDRLPHAVRTIQGTMNPLDSRFVMHGHLEEPEEPALMEGSLNRTEIQQQWQQMKTAGQMIRESGHHGFVTFETSIEPSGKSQTTLKHSQLLPRSVEVTAGLSNCVTTLLRTLSNIQWPTSTGTSRLVYALCSEPLL